MRNILKPQWKDKSICQSLLLKKTVLPGLLLLFCLLNSAYGSEDLHLTTYIGNGSVHMVATHKENLKNFSSNSAQALLEQLLSPRSRIIDADNLDMDTTKTTNTKDTIPNKNKCIYKAFLKSSSEIYTFGHPTNMCYKDSPNYMFDLTFDKLQTILPKQCEIKSITVAMAGYDAYHNTLQQETKINKLEFYTQHFAEKLNISPDNVYFCGGDQELINLICQIEQRTPPSTPKSILLFQLTTCLCVYTYHPPEKEQFPNNEGLQHIERMKSYNPQRGPKDGGTYQIGEKLFMEDSWGLNSENTSIKDTMNLEPRKLKEFMAMLVSNLCESSNKLSEQERKKYVVWLAFSNHLLQLNLKEKGLIEHCLKKEGLSNTLDFTKISNDQVTAASSEFYKIFHGDKNKTHARRSVAGTIFLTLLNQATFEKYNKIDFILDNKENQIVRSRDIWHNKHTKIFEDACKYFTKESEEDVLKVISGVTKEYVTTDNYDVYVVMDDDRYVPSDELDDFMSKIIDCAKTSNRKSVPIKFIKGDNFSTNLACAGMLLYLKYSKKTDTSDQQTSHHQDKVKSDECPSEINKGEKEADQETDKETDKVTE